MKITFEAKPIESAPKDRTVMVFTQDYGWHHSLWSEYHNTHGDTGWRDLYEPGFPAYPSHWAEIEEMKPEAK